MTLKPSQKQALSGLLVGVGGAAVVAVEQALQNPPVTLQSILLAALAGALIGLAHRVPAAGTRAAIIEAHTAATLPPGDQ